MKWCFFFLLFFLLSIGSDCCLFVCSKLLAGEALEANDFTFFIYWLFSQGLWNGNIKTGLLSCFIQFDSFFFLDLPSFAVLFFWEVSGGMDQVPLLCSR